jgi:two-component system, chemotaxis family, sensor kinase CheA
VEELFASLARDFVDESAPIAQDVGGLLLKLEEAWSAGSDGKEILRAIRGGLHTIKGNSAMMGLAPVERVAHALEDVCSQVDASRAGERSQLVQCLLEGCDLLGALIQSALSGQVDAEPADAFVQRAREANETARLPREVAIPSESPVRGEAVELASAPAVDGDDGRGSARIADRDVDELLELTGETIVGQTALARVYGRLIRGQIEASDIALMDQLLTDLGRTSREMRHKLLRVRLAPIETLFRRFGRFLRDLAHERGQAIELCIEGGETAVDRAIISRLYEPLVHIVRNAVAHGIESAGERAALGKPAKAQILLNARLREGRVNVSIADDGRGLDHGAIAAKAESQGLDTSGLSERDIQRLIFRSGFSTAASVSSLAGRGVGLDVVAGVVQGLGGSIDVRSAQGRGTVFVLDLPVTVSLQKALIFGVDSETFAIPAGFILDTMESREKDMQVINRVLLIAWRGDFVRAVDAGRLLGCQGLAEAWARPYAIVLQAGNKRGALLVDWLSGVQEIVVKSLDETLAGCSMVAGATVLAQGRVIPILDSVEVVRRVSAALLPESSKETKMEASYDVF